MFWMHLNSFLPISALHIATIATSNLNCIKAEQELYIISNNQSNNLHDFQPPTQKKNCFVFLMHNSIVDWNAMTMR